MGEEVIKVGSRKSELALIQTKHVISSLQTFYPKKKFEIVTMSTLGDKVLDLPLPKIGEKSLFTKELESALANGGVDFVVHSLKDLPTLLPENMAIGAILQREDPRDALVLRKDYKDCTLETLPKNSTIGTSSLRRAAQLHRYYPHLKIENIRGNLNTRLKKLDDLNKYEAIVLATAGLQRMGWHSRISKIINDEEILYAVGQGAIAVECREKDEKIISLLKPLYDCRTAIQIISERTFLKTLGGGCSAPVAVKTSLVNVGGKHKLKMMGAVWSLDGKDELKETGECEVEVVKNKCSVCPYKTCSTNGDKSSQNCDIECLETCKKKDLLIVEAEESKPEPSENGIDQSEPPNKKMKIEVEACPIKLPVGADFMGKCPYLEAQNLNGSSSVNLEINKNGNSVSKCPFRSKGLIVPDDENKSSKESQDSFCGLVPHPDISIEAYEEAEKLGREIADRLIEKGAKDIMIKAQNIIRNS